MAGTFAPFNLRRTALALVAATFPLAAQAQARGPDNIADVAEAVIDAVVNISTSQTGGRSGTPRPESRPSRKRRPQLPPGSPFEEFFEEFFKNRRGQGDPKGGRSRAGSTRSAPASSSIPTGIVVTNNHVIADADEITVDLQRRHQAQGRAGRQGHQDRSRAAAR